VSADTFNPAEITARSDDPRAEPPRLFVRMSDGELEQNGFDPKWFSDNDGDGPYRTYHSFDEICPCCENKASGWLVVDMETGTQVAGPFYDDNGEYDADEHANMLNAVWLKGAQRRDRT
jgi:hypothetical protein